MPATHLREPDALSFRDTQAAINKNICKRCMHACTELEKTSERNCQHGLAARGPRPLENSATGLRSAADRLLQLTYTQLIQLRQDRVMLVKSVDTRSCLVWAHNTHCQEASAKNNVQAIGQLLYGTSEKTNAEIFLCDSLMQLLFEPC